MENNNKNEENSSEEKSKYYCYIIRSTNPNYLNSTYNGSTNNLTRRLRQHNGEIAGGAKATKGKGPWVYFVIWEGFRTKCEALSCEWRIKHPTNSKKRPAKYNGVNGRVKSLGLLVGLDCWTGNSVGMGTTTENLVYLEYNLYVQEGLEYLIEMKNSKQNLHIKKLSDLILV